MRPRGGRRCDLRVERPGRGRAGGAGGGCRACCRRPATGPGRGAGAALRRGLGAGFGDRPVRRPVGGRFVGIAGRCPRARCSVACSVVGRAVRAGIAAPAGTDQRHVVGCRTGVGSVERLLFGGEGGEVVGRRLRGPDPPRALGRRGPVRGARRAVAGTRGGHDRVDQIRLAHATDGLDAQCRRDLGELLPILPVQLRTVEGVAHGVCSSRPDEIDRRGPAAVLGQKVANGHGGEHKQPRMTDGKPRKVSHRNVVVDPLPASNVCRRLQTRRTRRTRGKVSRDRALPYTSIGAGCSNLRGNRLESSRIPGEPDRWRTPSHGATNRPISSWAGTGVQSAVAASVYTPPESARVESYSR